ncbi:MAG: hypothetical protein DMG49_15940 [Acidobacteria bacterium]|nr:MAG: hypothetical protein DMG49_15940 [Acidobacteriota bacterium]
METGQGIGHGIEFQPLQLVVLDEDGYTKKTGGGKDIGERRFQRNLTTQKIGELAAAREHLIPNFYTLSFAQIEVSDRAEVSLEKLAARRQIKVLERIG